MFSVRLTLCLVATGCTLLTNCKLPTEEPVPKGKVTLALTWNPNPTEDEVIAYHIFRGPDRNANTPLTTVDGQTHEVEYDAHLLGLNLNDQICLRVKAENKHGFSGASDAACTTITADDL